MQQKTIYVVSRSRRSHVINQNLTTSQCATTITGSPSSNSHEDQFKIASERREALNTGRPYSMFEFQRIWEIVRLDSFSTSFPDNDHPDYDQLGFDRASDLKANAENNIRARWIAQGIWKPEWGPAWPSGSSPMDIYWLWQQEDPRQRPAPCGDWDKQEQSMTHATDRSRPYYQFCWKVKFEAKTTTMPKHIRIARVRKRWKDTGLWQDEWKLFPGMKWSYEYSPEEYAKYELDKRRIPKVNLMRGLVSITEPMGVFMSECTTPEEFIAARPTASTRRSQRLLAQQQRNQPPRRSHRLQERMASQRQPDVERISGRRWKVTDN